MKLFKQNEQQQYSKQRKPVLKFKKAKRSDSNGEDDIDDDDYQLNALPRERRPLTARKPATPAAHYHEHRVMHHQSFTFITDLAQTSTPTRSSHEPITSTPKQQSHDPLKYHPKQTIRSKKPVTATAAKRVCCQTPRINVKRDQCVQCVVAAAVAASSARRREKRKYTEESASAIEWDNCDLCNLSRAVSSIGEAAAVVRTVSRKKSQTVKFVKNGNNVEISLHDLLYAPAKPNKYDMVTTTRPRVKKQHSKVYYL